MPGIDISSFTNQKGPALNKQPGPSICLVDFGAFVEIFPGTDGLLPISEIAESRVKDVRDELKEDDQILVKEQREKLKT